MGESPAALSPRAAGIRRGAATVAASPFIVLLFLPGTRDSGSQDILSLPSIHGGREGAPQHFLTYSVELSLRKVAALQCLRFGFEALE